MLIPTMNKALGNEQQPEPYCDEHTTMVGPWAPTIRGGNSGRSAIKTTSGGKARPPSLQLKKPPMVEKGKARLGTVIISINPGPTQGFGLLKTTIGGKSI